MNKIALIVAALGVAGFTGAAVAQDASAPNGAGAPSFDTADANHDGFVDFGEAQAAYPGLTQNNFRDADANKDDKLTAAEYGQLGGAGQYNNDTTKSSSTTMGSSSAETNNGGSSNQGDGSSAM